VNGANHAAIGYAQLTSQVTGQTTSQLLSSIFGSNSVITQINTPMSGLGTGGTPIAYLNLFNTLAHGNGPAADCTFEEPKATDIHYESRSCPWAPPIGQTARMF
jgi:hypothetical protein